MSTSSSTRAVRKPGVRKPGVRNSVARETGAARGSYDFRELLTYRLLVLSNTLGKGAVRLYARRYDIPLAEWRLLAALVLEAPSSVIELARALRTDKGWVSRTAASLIDKGLAVSRDDPADGRRSEVDLTDAGRALYARIVPAAIARQRKLVEVLSASERKMLDRVLDKLQRRADGLNQSDDGNKND